MEKPSGRNALLSRQGEERKKLLASIPFSGEERLAAGIYLLEKRRLVRREDELQDILDCSKKQIQAARERIRQALANREDALGTYLETQRSEMAEKPSNVSTSIEVEKNIENPAVALKKLAEKYFGADAEHIGQMERRQRGRHVNWAVILVSQLALKKTLDEAAEIAGVQPASAAHMRRDGREEYAAQGHFYETVQKICKELGVRMP